MESKGDESGSKKQQTKRKAQRPHRTIGTPRVRVTDKLDEPPRFRITLNFAVLESALVALLSIALTLRRA